MFCLDFPCLSAVLTLSALHCCQVAARGKGHTSRVVALNSGMALLSCSPLLLGLEMRPHCVYTAVGQSVPWYLVCQCPLTGWRERLGSCFWSHRQLQYPPRGGRGSSCAAWWGNAARCYHCSCIPCCFR